MNLTSTTSSPAIDDRSEFLFTERYQYLAEYYGDKESKAHASEVKRTASLLRNAQETLHIFLEYEQLEALRAAVQVLDGFGKALDEVSVKARKILKTRVDNAQRKREESAENCAVRRWGTDNEAMVAEAQQLAEFVDNGYCSGAKKWIGERRGVKYATHYQRDKEFGPTLAQLLQPCFRHGGVQTVEIRLCAGEYINFLQESGASACRKSGDTWATGLDDFEAWKTRQVGA